MSLRIEVIGEQALPPSAASVSPEGFLTDVAPVLALSPQEISKVAEDPFMEANPYDLLVKLVDKVARRRTAENDKDFLHLVKVVIQGFQQYEDLKDALSLEGYTFEEGDLPHIVGSIASWACRNLVDVAAPIRRERRSEQSEEQSPAPPRKQTADPEKPSPQQDTEADTEKQVTPWVPPPPPRPRRATSTSAPVAPPAAPVVLPKSAPIREPKKPVPVKSTPAKLEVVQLASAASEVVYSSPFFNYRYNKNGRPALLIAEEEVELAKIIEAGVFAEEKLVNMGPEKDSDSQQTKQLRRDLSTIAEEGRRAFKFFVLANERLAWSIAVRRHPEQGLDRDDFGSFGIKGVIKAVKMFDFTKGYKFSTYATWWIRQSIDRGIFDTGRNIRLPVHVHNFLGEVKKKEQNLLEDLGRQPTFEELAKELNLTPERLTDKLEGTKNTISLNLPVGYDSDADTLIDFIKDRRPDVFSEVSSELNNRTLDRQLESALSQREQAALRAILDDPEQPQYQLSELFNMSIPAAQRLIRRTRAKLAHPSADIDSVISLNGAAKWRQRAICKHTDQLTFYLDFFALANTASEAEAQAICRHCPVVSSCLDFAFEQGLVDGIWGGMGENERVNLLRKRNRQQATTPKPGPTKPEISSGEDNNEHAVY